VVVVGPIQSFHDSFQRLGIIFAQVTGAVGRRRVVKNAVVVFLVMVAIATSSRRTKVIHNPVLGNNFRNIDLDLIAIRIPHQIDRGPNGVG
jgi:hypothetical protein